jgi:hypothetical protein
MNWTMVICTLDRFEVLKIALRTVLWQSRLPRQVIIVDASADWQRCREEVLREFAVPTHRMDLHRLRATFPDPSAQPRTRPLHERDRLPV